MAGRIGFWVEAAASGLLVSAVAVILALPSNYISLHFSLLSELRRTLSPSASARVGVRWLMRSFMEPSYTSAAAVQSLCPTFYGSPPFW